MKPTTNSNLQKPMSSKTLLLYLLYGGLLLGGVLWLLTVLHPLPPRIITLACGPEGSSYEIFGKRYKTLLEKQGIKVKLVTTAGGVENLALLKDPKSGVQLGFVEGGIAKEEDDAVLTSLGTLCYEPIWIFTRVPATDRNLVAMLKGKRVSIGPEGSSSREVVMELSKRKALDISSFKLMNLAPEASVDALLKGQIDAVVLVNSYASPLVRMLAKDRSIHLVDFSRADAYAARFPSLTKRVFPEGAADLEENMPSHSLTLLATKTSLLAREDLHPALQYLVLENLSQVHSRAGIFQKADEFPAAEELEITLSKSARHFYKSGEPFLQRYMPFWLAAMVEQVVLLLIPILGLTYPLIKGLMTLYGWGMQRKIFSIYGELHWLEEQIDRLGDQAPPEELLQRMKNLEERSRRVRVSSKYIPMVYSLKENLAVVRDRLYSQRGSK